jgi:inositol oxygenase
MADVLPAVEVDPLKDIDRTHFRDYENNSRHDIVQAHYRIMREKQTVEFVRRMHEKYNFQQPRAHMTVREAFDKLETFVDSSDPDVSVPNLVHLLQTAEGIRQAGLPDWMQLVGLVHDMGKIMFLWGTGDDGQDGSGNVAQWALGGDTWVVGCRLPECAVYHEFGQYNPDAKDPRYEGDLGMYTANCGLENVLFAYGHDEYMYQMVVANKCPFPEEGLYMIRYHSAYPWHQGRAYTQFESEKDRSMLNWIKQFNEYDLYTKSDTALPVVEELWPYYQSLIDKYMPGNLMW